MSDIIYVNPNDIKVLSDRYREDKGDIEDFAKNMYIQAKSLGILSNMVPVILTPEHVIIDGERRLLASRHIKNNINSEWQLKAEVHLQDISESTRSKVIEIITNKYRLQFNFKEDAKATRDLHNILFEEKEAKGKDWGLRSTAKELGISLGAVSTGINLANALEAKPELFEKCKTRSDALKIMKSNRLDELNKELAKRVSNNDYGQKVKNILFLGDMKDLIKQLPPQSVYAIISDPMYGVGMEATTRPDRVSEDRQRLDDSTDWFRPLMEDFAAKADKAMNKDAVICMFTAIENVEFLNNLWRNYGFQMDTVPAIWHKVGAHYVNTPSIYFGKSYEFIIYGLRGQATLLKTGISNVLSYAPVPSTLKQHPYEKPLALMDELISRFCLPGQTILDPMCGRATTLVSAIKRGCKVMGFEKDPTIYDRAVVRLEAAIKAKDAGLIDTFVD